MRVRPDHSTVPHPARLAPSHPLYAEILDAHAGAVARGDLTYTDPATGRSVFTSSFLTDRGSCCDSGCRHCPYIGAPTSP